MNLDKLFGWIVGVVLVFATSGRLDVLQAWIWRAQTRVIYESRTSSWGSPRFFNKAELSSPSSPKSGMSQNETLDK
jgi:hypothetical protein